MMDVSDGCHLGSSIVASEAVRLRVPSFNVVQIEESIE